MFVFVGFNFDVLSVVPNCPYPLYPHVHISPFAFSAAKKFPPAVIFGYTFPCVPFTFTFTAACAPVPWLYTFMYVFPVPVAVTIPSSDTVAMFSLLEVNLQLVCSNLSYNRLNPAVVLHVILLPVSPAF